MTPDSLLLPTPYCLLPYPLSPIPYPVSRIPTAQMVALSPMPSANMTNNYFKLPHTNLTATMKTPKLTPDSYWLTIPLFNGKRILDQLRFSVLEATYPGQASFNRRARGHLLLPIEWENKRFLRKP